MLVTIFFTQNSGLPATSLALADIALYLTAIAKADGAATVIWDGTQNPSAEIGSLGLYLRQYNSEDTVLYDYVAGAQYTGTTELDADWTTGVLSEPVKTDVAGRVEISGTENTLDTLLAEIQGSGWTDETLVALGTLLDAIKAKTDDLAAPVEGMVLP